MKISARYVALPAYVLGIALWAGPCVAAPESFQVPLNGAQEVPPVQSTGTATADLSYDPTTRVISWTITYSGLSGSITMAHFHGPAPAGKNGGVQIGLTKRGSAVGNPIKGHATLTPEQARQFAAGEWYINVHTPAHPAGEIRGQVIPPKD
jgi:CHRD domain